MIDALKPYAEYKESGVPWIGKIPNHWEARRLKSLISARITDGPHVTPVFIAGGIPFLSVDSIQNGELVFKKCRYISQEDHTEFRKKTAPRRDDILFGKAASTGKIARVKVDFEFSIWSPLALIRPDRSQVTSGFLEYSLKDEAAQAQIETLCTLNTQKNISMDDIPKLIVSFPSIPEQSMIVRFLDTQDRRINRLIRIKRRLIELLNEQKQAIIHRAVTRGLDPNVRLKPSGIEWLGKVPEHWCLRRVGLIFKERNQCGSNGLPILVVSLNTGVTVGNEEDEGGRPRRLIEDRSTYKLAIKGDVAYNMMRMWQGAVGVVPVDGLVSPAYIVAKPFPQMNSRYFTFIFRTDACKGEINCSSRGIVSDRNRLYWEDFKNLYLPVPDQREQDQIVSFIDMETRRIDQTIFSGRREIDLLREYRTRLISDVVTGKLDVRGVELPEIDEADTIEDINIDEDTEAEDLIESEEVANADE